MTCPATDYIRPQNYGDKLQVIDMLLEHYIAINYKTKTAFARHLGVTPQMVIKWINWNWIVIDGKIYSPQREIPPHKGIEIL